MLFRLAEVAKSYGAQEVLRSINFQVNPGEHVGLHEVDDGLWDVHFGPLCLGRLDERDGRIEDALGRKRRRQVSPMSPD